MPGKTSVDVCVDCKQASPSATVRKRALCKYVTPSLQFYHIVTNVSEQGVFPALCQHKSIETHGTLSATICAQG